MSRGGRIASVAVAVGLMAAGNASAQAAGPARGDAADSAPIVVVVESAHRATRPEAIRTALAARLGGAEVTALREAAVPPRARVLVAVHRDGSTELHIVWSSGSESAAHISAPSDEHSAAVAIAARIGELLGEVEESPPIGTAARHGLIPWEDEELRSYPDRSLDDEPLLPWPEGRTGTGPAREAGAGLTAPPPERRAQKR